MGITSKAKASAPARVSFGGLITISHDGNQLFRVQGPADDEKYTVSAIASKDEAFAAAYEQAMLKACDSQEAVEIESFIGDLPYESRVEPF